MTIQTVTGKSTTAVWVDIVNEGEKKAGIELGEELESYLVFLLMRYTERPEIAASPLAITYLQGLVGERIMRDFRLRDVADQSLLISGLFPGRAERRRVPVSYYVDLGRSAYQRLSEDEVSQLGDLFGNVAEHFIEMMDTLHAIRRFSQTQVLNFPMTAFDLWAATGSRSAMHELGLHSEATPVWESRLESLRH
jgi:hypothetical protein